MNGDFSILNQNGPFRIFNSAAKFELFSKSSKKLVNDLKKSKMTTRYRAMRNQIFDVLGISSFSEIQSLINDKTRRKQVTIRAYELLGNMFGIHGTHSEIMFKINSYAQTADSVIDYLKNGLLSDYPSYIEITNEIEPINNPIDLLLILFNDRYHKKTRFDAKRKLVLMTIAGSIDQRERETDIENKFSMFLDFLNDHVWSPELKIGEYETVHLLSTHDYESFACTDIRTLDNFGISDVAPGENQKLTALKRRSFHINGRKIPIYVTVRKKSPEAKVLKLIRKGQNNPAVAVDDELGLMGVLDSLKDVKLFQRHLTESATKYGTFMTLEDISDTLDGSPFITTNAGSSSGTRMFKFFAKMGGMRVEFIILTNETYLNYLYQRNISHGEYEIRRFVDSGVGELLFPSDIYDIDIQRIKDKLIHKFRNTIENR